MTERPALTDPMVAYQGYHERFEEDRKHYQHYGDLSLLEMRRVLDDLTYKPGVRMELREGPFPGRTILVLLMRVEDTYTPGRMIEVVHQSPVPPFATWSSQTFVTFVASCLERMEVHECREWFKWRQTGRPINDPHADDGGLRPSV